MTLGSNNISPRSLHLDERVGWVVTIVGIPSAFMLHGYVVFIFGSIKANAWWSSPLMPVVFIFSAMVSGIAGVMVLYMAVTKLRGKTIDMHCVDTIAMYLRLRCYLLCLERGEGRRDLETTDNPPHDGLVGILRSYRDRWRGPLAMAAFVITPNASHVAFIRTLAVCGVALALAFGVLDGSAWR